MGLLQSQANLPVFASTSDLTSYNADGLQTGFIAATATPFSLWLFSSALPISGQQYLQGTKGWWVEYADLAVDVPYVDSVQPAIGATNVQAALDAIKGSTINIIGPLSDAKVLSRYAQQTVGVTTRGGGFALTANALVQVNDVLTFEDWGNYCGTNALSFASGTGGYMIQDPHTGVIGTSPVNILTSNGQVASVRLVNDSFNGKYFKVIGS